jgi:hypothetical protein
LTVNRVLEICSYQLVTGGGETFRHLVTEKVVPLHQSLELDIVAHGCSLHAPDHYFLLRTFDDLEHREVVLTTLQRAAWQDDLGPALAEVVIGDTCTTFWLEPTAIDQLRTPTR